MSEDPQTLKDFFDTKEWQEDLAERIIKDLGKALPCSNLIMNRYGLDIKPAMLMRKAKEIADLKPKIPRPKLKGMARR